MQTQDVRHQELQWFKYFKIVFKYAIMLGFCKSGDKLATVLCAVSAKSFVRVN